MPINESTQLQETIDAQQQTIKNLQWEMNIKLAQIAEANYRSEMAQARMLALENSTIWRSTAPIRKILAISPLRNLLKEALKVSKKIIQKKQTSQSAPSPNLSCVDDILSNYYLAFNRLNILKTEHEPRVNLLIPTFNEKSIYAGCTTAIIFAISLANKMNAALRVITVDQEPIPSTILTIAAIHNIKLPKNYEIIRFNHHTHNDLDQKLGISPNDCFIGTMWNTALLAREMSYGKRYIWLVQEHEKIFYANGLEHILIDRLFADPNMLAVVNTQILYDFLSNQPYPSIKNNGLFFEPAFPHTQRSIQITALKKSKYNLFFYSRPKTPRNLYPLGLDLLNKAIQLGIINPKEWNIYFAGEEADCEIKLSESVEIINLGKLSWSGYYDLIKTIDLGICLMLAPCPSYPPIDLAAAGGVVLTNTSLGKEDLRQYSNNIIASDLDEDSLLNNFMKAIALSKNPDLRYENFINNSINSTWENALKATMDRLHLSLKNEPKSDAIT